VKECVGRGCEASCVLSIGTRWGHDADWNGSGCAKRESWYLAWGRTHPLLPTRVQVYVISRLFIDAFLAYVWLPTHSIKIVS